MITRILIGLLISGAIGFAGYTKKALNISGVIGAILVGTLIYGLGGWQWGLLLVSFFIGSSLLSRFKEREKTALAEKFAKGHERDLGQTLANGGLGALLAIASILVDTSYQPVLFAAFIGAMATVNADTWATEIGVLSAHQPRMITNGQPVQVGTSGGITILGTAATVVGSAFIGSMAIVFSLLGGGSMLSTSQIFLIGTISGLAGAFFDSFLGATIQAIYYCDHCKKETEKTIHICGESTRMIRGWKWLN
ncbi:MAG: DUF92 domain-containing protein, partial [Anaerolineales bacterium]|nr:DUF92 domain-containing protein [Anaerolineales bacterium]